MGTINSQNGTMKKKIKPSQVLLLFAAVYFGAKSGSNRLQSLLRKARQTRNKRSEGILNLGTSLLGKKNIILKKKI